MVRCHQHDCNIEFRPLLAVSLVLHNIEIDFLDKDHHRSIFALVGIKNWGIYRCHQLEYEIISNPRLFLVSNFRKIGIPAAELLSFGVNLISTTSISGRFFVKGAITTNGILDIEKIINIVPMARICIFWKLVPKFHYWSLSIFMILLFCKWRSNYLRYRWLQTVFKWECQCISIGNCYINLKTVSWWYEQTFRWFLIS